ncbi:hypothetical protein CVU75_00700 [Candidatus Dependentiae bacterium HGW-Dependentiae-1]|nr:MAG: hypothetical protein CVU75_00700 [Candidatus Dependentiae bacterium HGW-Dependentiae-1]
MYTIQKTNLARSLIFFCGSLMTCISLNGMEHVNSGVFFGMHNVLFKEKDLPWLVKKTLVLMGKEPTTKIFLDKLFEDLKDIPESEIPGGAAGIPEDGEEPLLVRAWVMGRVTNAEAKKITHNHTSMLSIARIVANSMFNPEDVAKELLEQKPIFNLAEQCKNNGNDTGICSSWNGEAFDTMFKVYPALRTFKPCYISGNRQMLPCEPRYYDEMITAYAGKPIYFVDAPGTALGAAQQKGIRTFEFHIDQSGALDELTAKFQREGLISEANSHDAHTQSTLALLTSQLKNVKISPNKLQQVPFVGITPGLSTTKK